MAKVLVILFSLLAVCYCQRPSYAGRNPVGYPRIDVPITTITASGNAFGDRFNNDMVSTTTQRIPVEANGDAGLVQRLSQLPPDRQPFWYLNWQALEQMRNQPQSYPVKGNNFVDFASSQNRPRNMRF